MTNKIQFKRSSVASNTPTTEEAINPWEPFVNLTDEKLFISKWDWTSFEVWWEWTGWSTWWNAKTFTLWEDLSAWEVIRIINDWWAKIKKALNVTSAWNWWIKTIDTDNAFDIVAVLIDTNKFLLTYSDQWQSTYWKVVVWTISWNTITLWSVQTFNSASSSNQALCKIDTNKVVVSWRWTSNYWTALVMTVSWTVVSFWTPQVFHSATVSNLHSSNMGTDKFAIAFTDWSDSNRWKWIVATVSWTVMTFWTVETFNTSTSWATHICMTEVWDDKVAIGYRDQWNWNYWTWMIFTASWTNIAFWNKYQFNSWETNEIDVILISPNKLLYVYKDASNSNYWTARVGTISWTTITYSWSETLYESSATYRSSVAKLDDDIAIVAYRDSSAKWQYRILTITWTSISPWTEINFNSNNNTDLPELINIGMKKVLFAYRDDSTSAVEAFIRQETYSDWSEIETAWILQETWTFWQTKNVMLLWWISTVHSSLTIWAKYYLQTNWTIWTWVTDYCIGRAVSTTEINTWENNI